MEREEISAVKFLFQLFFFFQGSARVFPKTFLCRKNEAKRKIACSSKIPLSPLPIQLFNFRPLKIMMIMVIKIIIASLYTSFNHSLYFRIIICYGFVQYKSGSVINSSLVATKFVPKAVIFGYSFSFSKKVQQPYCIAFCYHDDLHLKPRKLNAK